jgi:hypothetical protein
VATTRGHPFSCSACTQRGVKEKKLSTRQDTQTCRSLRTKAMLLNFLSQPGKLQLGLSPTVCGAIQKIKDKLFNNLLESTTLLEPVNSTWPLG